MSKENKLGEVPMASLMARMSIPIVLSMMFQAFYNIVDSAYLANMKTGGEEALTALGLAFPLQLFLVAVSIGTGVGTNALVARLLGEGKKKEASKVVGNAFFSSLVVCVVFILISLFALDFYVNFQNRSGSISGASTSMAISYLRICTSLSFGLVFFCLYEKILQASGNSVFSAIPQFAGAAVNIILDPFFIYGWSFFPEMGVKGAAIATVLGQIVSALMAIIFHLRLDKDIENNLKNLKPDKGIIYSIYKIGLPAMISQALLTVMTYSLNLILSSIDEIGEACVTVYGLYCKVQQLIIFAAVGVRDAITSIVSFNYGMGDKRRVKDGIKIGLLYSFALMVLGTVAIEIFAPLISSFFSLSGDILRISVSCMRIVSLAFTAAGLSIALQGVFQALARGIESLTIALGRQVVFLLPFAAFLSSFVKSAASTGPVWWSFLIAEILTLLTGVIMYNHVARKMQLRVINY